MPPISVSVVAVCCGTVARGRVDVVVRPQVDDSGGAGMMPRTNTHTLLVVLKM
jgi:hypothetical protein